MGQEPVTIIVGGGKGLGRIIAMRMARETSILVVGRDAEELNLTCSFINEEGGQADFCVDDATDPECATRVVTHAYNAGQVVRNLIYNAGFAKSGRVTELHPATWQQMFDVNVNGAFHFVQACLPDMIDSQMGSISFISSTAGVKGFKYDSAYCATKFAVNGFAQSLAAEYAKHNISIAPICPGYIQGGMTDRTVETLMKTTNCTRQDAFALLATRNEQGRILCQTEVAEAVAFVASGGGKGQPIMLQGETDARILTLVNWIRKEAASARKLIVPVSGGTDSTLVFKLCSLAYPDKTIGVFAGRPQDLRCREYLEQIGSVLYVSPDGGSEIQRWAAFLTVSQEQGGWLVGCRNRTEDLTGFYSMASRVATFLPIAGTWKSDVMELCKQINVPQEIMDSSRRADPNCGRPVELAEIPLETIDRYMKAIEQEVNADLLVDIPVQQREYLQRLVDASRFKRFLPTMGPSLP